MLRRNALFFLLAIVATVLLAAVALHRGETAGTEQWSAPQAETGQVVPQRQSPAPSGALPDFSTLVDQAGPAVVNISVIQQRGATTPGVDPNPGDPMSEFLRRFQVPEQPPQQGVGSGFIISADGHILTNAHVVADASEVTVRLTDKREFQAKVLGTDRRTDVALIKVEATALPTVRIGDSSKSKVGAWVAAIGSPFGFDNSVTSGIISAKARALPEESDVPFLQTDVAINPGNSGGPLFNMNGDVIGINSQIYSRTGGYMGLSFAIPIEVAMKVKDDLQKYGKVSRGRLGVGVQPLSRDLAESFGMKTSDGALVTAVENGSPAARAGIASGDVIVGIDDRVISTPTELVQAIGNFKPGQEIVVKIWRNGKPQDINVKLAESPPEKTAAMQ